MKTSSISFKLLPLFLTSMLAGSIGTQASPVYDREFSMEKIGVLKPWDNADQSFAELVRAAYEEYFTDSSRFRYQDLSRSDSLLTKSKIPYNRVIDDVQVLQQVGKSFKLDGLVRTRIFRERGFYEVQMDWLNLPKGDWITSENFHVQEPQEGLVGFPDRFKTEIKDGITRMLQKIPFKGQITGIDNDWITVNIGSSDGVYKGDALIVQTIEDVRRHPLLKQVVDWKFERVGQIKVEDLDRHIAFCKVIEKDGPRDFAIMQKVTSILSTGGTTPVSASAPEPKKDDFDRPRTGWVMASLGAGSQKRSYANTVTSPVVGKDGGGFGFQADVQAQVWLTKHWFGELEFMQGFMGYSQTDLPTSTQSTTVGGSGGLGKFQIGGGYTFYGSPDFFGPRGWVKAGYRRTSFSYTDSVAEYLAGLSVGSFILGIGGDLPLRPGWGLQAEFDFGLLMSAGESSALSGAANNVLDTRFYFGAYYWMGPKFKLYGGLELLTLSATFGGGATASQKAVNFVPSLMVYF